MSARGSNPVVITIDGPAGVGKSTLARQLAQTLGLPFLDTGAMFRTLAHTICRLQGVCTQELPQPFLEQAFASVRFSLEGCGDESRLLCNGKAMGPEIRTEEVGAMAAAIGANPQVREFLKREQQSIAQTVSLVAEGRDMGTVVFPLAACKFFLDAAPEVRAVRRQTQLREQGRKVDIATLVEQIRERDALDRSRKTAPLRPAEDAVLIDTSHLDMPAVLGVMLRELETRGLFAENR